MINIVTHLVTIRHEIFEEALNYSMATDFKSFDEVCEVGDIIDFEIDHLDNSNDNNLQLLVDLIKKVEQTTDSLADLNSIDLNELEI